MKSGYRSLTLQAQAERERRRRNSWREPLARQGYDPDVVFDYLVQMAGRLLEAAEDPKAFPSKAETEQRQFRAQLEKWKHENGETLL